VSALSHADAAGKAARVVVAMMAKDLILSVSHERGTQRWWLNDGRPVSDIVARRMISGSRIVPNDDGLFPAATLSHTYRHVSTER
jgi:hypothetical protein